MRNRDLLSGLLVPLLLLMIPLGSTAVERMSRAGARAAALSLAVVAVPGSFTVFQNQAFLTEEKAPSVSVSYTNPYSIPGYHENYLSLVCPIQSEFFALALSQTSLAGYKESSLGISLAKKLSGRLSAGILFNFYDLNFPEEGSHKGSVQADAGLGYKFSDQLSLGLHFRNLVATRVETFQYHLNFPLLIRIGASCHPSDRILVACEADFEAHNETEIHFGTEYRVVKDCWIRGGIATHPFRHSVGFGYRLKDFLLDFALMHHEILGFTPLFSLSFYLK